MFSLADIHAFDLLLIGEYLPDAQCEDVLKALTRRMKHTPCIVMQSGAPASVDFTRFRALGVSDIVRKRNSLQIVDFVQECLAYDEKQLQAA
jgi:hypothetical protein